MDILEVAKSISGAYQTAFYEGYTRGIEEGKRQAKVSRYALHGITRIGGQKITDQDGHWDGDGHIYLTVNAIPTKAELEELSLELAFDLFVAKELVEKVGSKLEEVGEGKI